MDRGNLSVALSHIQRDIHLDQERLGRLSMAFFLTYSLFQIVAGKLIDKFNVNWVFAAGYLLWSGATFITGFARDVHIGSLAFDSFVVLFVLRLILGVGESIAYPSYSKIITGCFPEGLRGTANAAIDAGSKVGPALGVNVGVVLIHRFEWRGMFIAIGAISLIWLIPWVLVVPHLKLRQDTSHVRAPEYGEILTKRPFWGTVIGLFGANYTWYLLLTWLPYYLEKERHYSSLALFSSLPFWGIAASSMTLGVVADMLIRRGRPARRVRQITICIGLFTCCIFMLPGVMVHNQTAAIVSLVLAAVCLGGFSSNHWALAQTLSGPEAAGKWTALQNCAGNLAGVAAAWITGTIVNYLHSFPIAFAVSCGMLLMAIFGYWVVVGNTNRVHWSTEQSQEPVAGFDERPAAR